MSFVYICISGSLVNVRKSMYQIYLKIDIIVPDYMLNTVFYEKISENNPAIFGTRLNTSAYLAKLHTFEKKNQCTLKNLILAIGAIC
jgi:hypothetical protein